MISTHESVIVLCSWCDLPVCSTCGMSEESLAGKRAFSGSEDEIVSTLLVPFLMGKR